MTIGQTGIDAVAAARATLGDLQRQRAEAVARTEALAAEREGIAFDAATGNAAARKALAAATREASTAGLDIQNADAAIAEARRRLVMAEQEAAAERQREVARRARAKLIELRALGDATGNSLHSFVTNLEEFYSCGDEIRHLGVGGAPGRDLIRVNAVRVIQAELMKVRLNSVTIPPNQRQDFGALVKQWAEQIEARIADILGDSDKSEAA